MGIMDWWKRKTCAHLNRRTEVWLHAGGMVETITICEDCGDHVPPMISFGINIIEEWLLEAKQLNPGESKLAYGAARHE